MATTLAQTVAFSQAFIQGLPLTAWGIGGEPALTIANQVQAATPEQKPTLEAKLLGVLAAGEATFPAKQYACRMLKLVGSEKSVPDVVLAHSLLEKRELDKILSLGHLTSPARINLPLAAKAKSSKAYAAYLKKIGGK